MLSADQEEDFNMSRVLPYVALAAILMLSSPVQGADKLSREQVLQTLVSVSSPSGGWQCHGGDTCHKLHTARTTFTQKGADMFVQSDFPLGLHRMARLNRAVIISTGEYSWDPWKVKFQVEYFVNSDAFPMMAECDVRSATSISCNILVGEPVTPGTPAGSRMDSLQWRYLGYN